MRILKHKPLKIAIVHDSFVEFGGAERVLFSMIKAFPNADLYTSLIKKDFYKKVIKKTKGKVYFSKLSNFSFITNFPSFFKPYFFHYYWGSLNLDEYDLVISSSHSFCANWVNVKNKHISYIHTPPRFLYDEFNEIDWLRKPIIKAIIEPYWRYLRRKDCQNIQKINLLIANSKNVKRRIEKYYKKSAIVIYPPIKLIKNDKKTNILKKDSYLFFSRLVKQKGIELVIKTFNKNKKKLLVVGTSSQERKWKKMSKNNISFLGFIEDKKMEEIFNKSKALIYASINEDFGMIPVEAMSCGLPVIAYKDGGVKESIVEGKTGLFFKKHNERDLEKAINQFEKTKFKDAECLKQAKKFDENIFIKKLLDQVKSI